MATYLQRAIPSHTHLWYTIIQDEYQRLQKWMPHLTNLHNLTTAETYIRQHIGEGFYMSEQIYEIWEEKDLVGLLTLHAGNINNQSAELAYWLGNNYTGKGIVTSAVKLLCSKVFTDYPQIQQLYIKCQVDNLPSQAVALRLDFKHLDKINGIISYSMTKENWLATHYDESHLLHFLDELEKWIYFD